MRARQDVDVLSPGGKESSALMRGLAGFLSRVKASEFMAFWLLNIINVIHEQM